MITHNCTDTAWFHKALAACSAICFIRRRIKFWKANGEVSVTANGQAVFSNDISRFYERFSELGFILVPCR